MGAARHVHAKGPHRNLTNSQFKIIVSDEEFDEWEQRFSRQMRTRFRKERVVSSSRNDGLGLGLRSAVESLSLLDDAVASLKTSEAKRLSRLHWEDVVGFQEGERLFVYFRRMSPVVDERFSSVPEDVRMLQQLLGVGGGHGWMAPTLASFAPPSTRRRYT